MPPVYPITWYPPIKLGRYPHMARRDAPVWEKWLSEHTGDAIQCAYDIALGGRILNIPGATLEEVLGWQYLTALRIDVTIDHGDRWEIIEVRPDATVSALGAALCYLRTAERLQLTDLPMSAAILCQNIQPDVALVAADLDITVITVPT